MAKISCHEHKAPACYLEQDDEGRALKQWLNNADSHLHSYHSEKNIFRDGLHNKGLYLFRKLDIGEDEIRLQKEWNWLNDKVNAVEYPRNNIRDIRLSENNLLLKIHVENSLLAFRNSGFNDALLEKLLMIELNYQTGTLNFYYHNVLSLIHYK